jgi:DegV family protein with EDD domain
MSATERRSVAIVADSTISLPIDLVRDLDIHIVPLGLALSGETYQDGVDLQPGEFYDLLKQTHTTPTTSAPAPESFLQTFTRLAEVADSVICLTLSSNLSSTHQAAEAASQTAKDTLPGFPIMVVDTHTAAAAEGLIVLEAARAAQQKATADQILELIRSLSLRVRLIGYLDTLYYLRKSGRIPLLASWMGTLLNIKPLLELANGGINLIERPRTKRRAIERLLSNIESHAKGHPIHAIVVHAASPRDAEDLRILVQQHFTCHELHVTEFTPIIGAHIGPGLVGCAFYVDRS